MNKVKYACKGHVFEKSRGRPLIRAIHNKRLFDSENFSSFAKFAFHIDIRDDLHIDIRDDLHGVIFTVLECGGSGKQRIEPGSGKFESFWIEFMAAGKGFPEQFSIGLAVTADERAADPVAIRILDSAGDERRSMSASDFLRVDAAGMGGPCRNFFRHPGVKETGALTSG